MLLTMFFTIRIIERVGCIRTLGRIHSHICTTQQRTGIFTVLRIAGNTNAATDVYHLIIEQYRLLKHCCNPVNSGLDCQIGDLVQQQSKFVTAEPCHSVRLTKGDLQTSGYNLENGVTGFVAKYIIDVLEPVHVQNKNRERFIPALTLSNSRIQSIIK